MLYTTYLANVKKIERTEDTVFMLIARYTPKNRRLTDTGIEHHVELSPPEILFQQWKQNEVISLTWNEFKERLTEYYYTNTASLIGISKVEELVNNNKDVYLICYEKESDICHRSVLLETIKQRGNIREELIKGEY